MEQTFWAKYKEFDFNEWGRSQLWYIVSFFIGASVLGKCYDELAVLVGLVGKEVWQTIINV